MPPKIKSESTNEYKHQLHPLNKCNKTDLINNFPLNYHSNDVNHVDYPTPAAVKRIINPIGCTRVSPEVAELPENDGDILKPSFGLMGIVEDSVRSEKSKLGIESEEMCASMVPRTPMELQVLELVCGSNEVVGVTEKDEAKMSEEVCEGKEAEVEMGKINEGKVDVDSQEMCDSVVDETQFESQVNEVSQEINVSLDDEVKETMVVESENNMDVDSGGLCDSMVPETPMESQEVHLVSGEFVGVCQNGEVEEKDEGSREMTDSCGDEMGVESEGRSDSIVPETPMESQEVNMTGESSKVFEVKGTYEVKVKIEEEAGVQREILLGDEAKVKMGVQIERAEEKNISGNDSEGNADGVNAIVKQEQEKKDEIVRKTRKISSVDVVNVEDDDEAVSAKYKHEKYSYAKPVYVKQEAKVEPKSNRPPGLQDGEYPEEPEWWWPLGDAIVVGRSTAKGKKLELNELVDIKFCTSWRSNIIRFETKRCGELGTLPLEWAKCLMVLFMNDKLKVRGRCIDYPGNLTYHQEVMLSLRCYLHKSLFVETNHACWSLLPALFKLMGVQPFKQAECTPEYLKSQKRSLNLQSRTEIASAVPPSQKRRKGGSAPQITDNTDEQSLSESTLNKIIGAAEVYYLEEMEPPSALACDLRPYQKQALYWMCRLESKEDAAHTLHPYYAEYQMHDGEPIYLNTFSGEATTKMPTATDSSRGGILADAMGMGKTVMTIALIHARPGRGIPADTFYEPRVSSRVKGGTLIVCPMALLGQWKDELETHSEPDSLSVSVHYGGNRTNDPRVMATHDVVLTTYGVLNSAFKSYKQNSIYHMVDWRRVVLDEAHTIKAWKTQTAQAAFALSSHSRWCLTGTPIQNSLEDLYSLFNFMKVEPWCDWNNWRNTIQKPYESGDPIGLTYVKAILKPLMLRRTKDTRDKEGSLILELPPIEVKTVECEQSEAEHDFYDALFRRSKVQFDEFLAQGRVLHNYASILELLLRLRQCCNHPFLVMSRSNSQLWDLQKLAKRFLESNADSASSNSRAYIEEVVEGIQRGDHVECPICLESADNPVVTPCGHKMCKECLLQSWRSPISGSCPICRRTISVSELIICPSDTRLQIDVEENWRESSKVSMLLKCLDEIRSDSDEKSIVFSQWTSFLDLLEIPLKRMGVGFLRFDGSLTQKQREKVLKEFNKTKDKTVLLMSLKAGGVGLNLTAASNVFLMDPWWNPAVEEQAIMRIHRIGQKHTVKVKKFIVKDTVEERLQQVQARKQNMIAGALTDDDVRSARLEDLKMLFR